MPASKQVEKIALLTPLRQVYPNTKSSASLSRQIVAPYASATDRLPKPFEQADSVRLGIGGREPHGIRIENFTSAMERRV